MRIDERVEQHVRDAYAGAIAKSSERVEDALAGLDSEGSRAALRLWLSVVGFIVHDVYRDAPTEQDYRDLAQRIVESESDWVGASDVDHVTSYLKAAAAGDGSPALDAENLTGLGVVCGANLLATFHGADQKWWDYLNEIWAALEASPGPAS